MSSARDVTDLGLIEEDTQDVDLEDGDALDIPLLEPEQDAPVDGKLSSIPDIIETVSAEEGHRIIDAATQQEGPSTPDDTLSVQDSVLSSSRRQALGSPGRSFRPFDRRFSARLSPSPLATPRPSSPAFLTGRSRQPSALHQFLSSENGDGDTAETPWEVFRWTKLRKLSGEAFSEIAKRNYGRPTCMAVASLIAIGTSKGLILIFDYHQNLKTTIGLGTKAIESGAVTAIALSADYTIVGGGHSNGSIYTWEIARPIKPFLSIAAINPSQLQTGAVEGHVMDSSVLHLGFLGTRHTALVSADVRGMAFSHLATRGLGAIARSVKTARILGRYPDFTTTQAKSKKPSSVLAFSSLPLGNSESPTDTLGLVAMLTPYLLVVVSTTPVAQTQHKANRPKELAAHGAMTGALAWYPAMKGKLATSNPKLAYCWLNVLTIIEIIEIPNETNQEAPVEISFKFLKRWKTDESIVAMQWLNRSVLAILTISQQLIILEDSSLAVTDSSDLIKRHIFHSDLFSQQLSHMIESTDHEDTSMHGVVADAFYMSFRAYKGRLFLLGFSDVSIGTLSNWADRLLALMEHGDFISAIQLATSYYTGGPEKAALGLPMDEQARHDLVSEKLLEMISASLKYAFGKNPDADSRVDDVQLEHLAQACFASCMKLNDLDFLFEEVYSWYFENNASQIFLDILETYIVEEQIRTIPPAALKDLVNSFVSKGRNARLEEILCLLDPATMDLEQVTLLCREFKLYDALFYIWSQAIGDYTTVLKNLLAEADNQRSSQTNETQDDDNDEDELEHIQSKVFPYLSYTLTGRIYPTGDSLPDDIAFQAKAEMYHFLFSGSDGQSYQHLRQALDLDAPSFLTMLNEAYEDGFLDGNLDAGSNTNGYTEEERFAVSLTRQYIIRVLLEVLIQPDYDAEDTIYLDMFIARNQPKFPQFIRLPGNVLQKVMVNLCLYPSEEMAEDCQLSLEYLLSVYQPPDITSILPDLERAQFWRVIKSIYRTDKQYAKLLETCFKDKENPDAIFDCIRTYLRSSSDITSAQLKDFRVVLSSHLPDLLDADLAQTAIVIEEFTPELHDTILQQLRDDEHSQYQYLRHLLDNETASRTEVRQQKNAFVEQYIRLLCEYNPHHVSEYLDKLDSSNLQLDHILPALESSGVIDAAVMLMTKNGQFRQAMDRLLQHFRYLQLALGSLLSGAAIAPDEANTIESANDLIESVERYTKVGIWLCNTQAKDATQSTEPQLSRRISRIPPQFLDTPLSSYETLWLDLIDAVVRIARNDNDLNDAESQSGAESEDTDSILHQDGLASAVSRLRVTVQDAFSALLVATSTSSSIGSQSNLSFLRILRAFLTRASESTPSLVHLRGVLGSIFAAYAYEDNILKLSNRLLDKELFVRVEEVSERRKRGWRPSGQTCNGCGKRVWGPGSGAESWNAWYERQIREGEQTAVEETQRRTEGQGAYNVTSDTTFGRNKGKGKAIVQSEEDTTKAHKDAEQSNAAQTGDGDENEGSLIVFSCRHIWHRRCLAASERQDGGNRIASSRYLVCPLENIAT